MDLSTTLTQLTGLPVEDRIKLVHALWDSIAEDQKSAPLSEAEKRVVDSRIADLDANPENVLTWKK